MQNDTGRIVIIGAGPCGIGAAWRLSELGYNNFEVYEKNDYAGGLSASFCDQIGFVWDIGGHVLFSHYNYFDGVMSSALPVDQWLAHERESWIWMRGRFIPYPLQYNIGRLPEKERMECLAGLISCNADGFEPGKHNFLDWLRCSFGDGIARHFLIPYNYKVWAYPPEMLDAHWIGERVAVPNIDRIMKNIIADRDDCSWGPNNTFSFPLQGGTGSIWNALAERLPADKIHIGTGVERWDPERKTVYLSDGTEQRYDYLISTMPLDVLLHLQNVIPVDDERGFLHSSSNIVGIGLKGAPPERLRTKCWMYFPEDDNPFYRVTVFSNYSPGNVPDTGCWSLMGEVSESPQKPVEADKLLESAVKGFLNTRLIENRSDIVSTWTFRAEYAYPTPFLGRDRLLEKYLPALQEHGVYSRGRFGAWKYEIGNMDHSLMQGVEAVEHILFGTPEITLNYPALVNKTRVR